METLDQARARSEASGRYRSMLCNDCYFISELGRCQNALAQTRYSSRMYGEAACEDWVDFKEVKSGKVKVRNPVHKHANYTGVFKP